MRRALGTWSYQRATRGPPARAHWHEGIRATGIAPPSRQTPESAPTKRSADGRGQHFSIRP
eukprot:5838180-Prymnesium_polylepis.1